MNLKKPSLILAMLTTGLITLGAQNNTETLQPHMQEALKNIGAASFLPFKDFAEKTIVYDKSPDILKPAPAVKVVFNVLPYDNSKVIPSRITYQSAPQEVLVAVLQNLRQFFNNEKDILYQTLIIGPHINETFRLNDTFNTLSKNTAGLTFRTNGIDEIVYSKVLSGDYDRIAAANFIKNLVKPLAAVNIRKLNQYELDWYWTIISYDIFEPVFVLETNGKSYLLHFANQQLFYIDDISGINWKKDKL